MAAGPGPGSHWVSINIVIGKQQDTEQQPGQGQSSSQSEARWDTMGQSEARDGHQPSSPQGSTRSNWLTSNNLPDWMMALVDSGEIPPSNGMTSNSDQLRFLGMYDHVILGMKWTLHSRLE